jgi:uncharacterized DUF497 family protein
MTFDWDIATSEHNLRSRGFDFAFASQIFEGRCLAQRDHRWDYGEERHIAIGSIDGICLTVVYTDRVFGMTEQLLVASSAHD